MPNLPNLGGNYGLGTTNPPTKLENLGLYDPIGELQPYTQLVETTGNNRPLQLGRPIAIWRWGLLTQRGLNRLMYFVSGWAQRVFMTTRVPSGDSATYQTFSAVMQYPSKLKSKPGGLWEDVEIVFKDLVNA